MNDYLFDAINTVMSSSKTYTATAEERRFLEKNVTTGDHIITATNFAVESNLPTSDGRSVISILEVIYERPDRDRSRYMEGVVTHNGALVYKYFCYSDGTSEIVVDVDGPWKTELVVIAKRVQ